MDVQDRRSSSSPLKGAVRPWAVAAGLALAGAWLCGAVPLARAADDAGAWQTHKLTFNYVGISPTYSCEGLRDDLTFLLQQAGAHLDGAIVTESCFHGAGAPSSLVSAQLRFSTLQPATGAAGETADQGNQGNQADTGSAGGSWRHVEFSNTRSYPQLRGADCELVQEFQHQILPAFATRNVTANLHCVPYQTTGDQFALAFDVFVPSSSSSREIGGRD
jgi:hypothetical protein